MSLVTIRGQLGSGAPEIGREVAHKLHFDYVDREIIAEVAARLQREERDVIAKEMPPGTLLGRILEALTSNYAGDAMGGRISPTGAHTGRRHALYWGTGSRCPGIDPRRVDCHPGTGQPVHLEGVSRLLSRDGNGTARGARGACDAGPEARQGGCQPGDSALRQQPA